MRRYILSICLFALCCTSCQSLDDDSDLEIKTYASFFIVQQNDNTLSLARLANGLETDWNEAAGISNADLSGAQIEANQVWLSSASQKKILAVGPSTGKTIESYRELPIAPHIFCIGEKYILFGDSVANRTAMLKRKNGKIQLLEFEGKPGQCIYNSGKFYLQFDQSKIAIIDELAMTPRDTIDLGLKIDWIQFDRYNSVIVSMHDSTKRYQTLIGFNGDYQVGDNYEVLWQKWRSTPYFATRFGNEYLHSIYLRDSSIKRDNNDLIVASASDFEVDFFESKLFYLSNSQLHIRTIASDSILGSYFLEGKLMGAFHQYAKE